MKIKRKYICNVLTLLCFTLLLSGSRCSWGDLPPISNIISGTRDFTISSVSLSYNLSYQYLDSLRTHGIPTILDDYYYINSYHPGLYMSNGTITSFGDILVENMDYSSCTKGPSVNFAFRHARYSGEVSRPFSSYDHQLCDCNIISDAPWINERHIIAFKANTVMTPNGIQLLWETCIDMNGSTVPGINDSMKQISTAVTKSGVGNSSNSGGSSSSNPRQDVAIGDEDEYDPVGDGGGNSDSAHADLDDGIIDNTVSDDLPSGDYYVVPSDSALVFSPVLLQPVYSGGILRNDLRWTQPVRAILDPVESDDGETLPEPDNSMGIITIE